MSWTSIERYSSGIGSEEVISLALLQDLARDDELLDLAGALVDPQCAHLPVQPFDGGAPHHALAAVDLDGAIHHALRGLGRAELGRRSLRRDLLRPPVLEPARAPDEQAGGVEADVH